MSSPAAISTLDDTLSISDIDTAPPLRLPPSPPQSPKPAARPSPKKPALGPVERALGLLFLRYRGCTSSSGGEGERDWRTFRLTSAEFGALEERVLEEGIWDWWQEKVRYDWEAPEGGEAKGWLVLRMPSRVHELFNEAVKREIQDGIARLAGQLEGGHGGLRDCTEVGCKAGAVKRSEEGAIEVHEAGAGERSAEGAKDSSAKGAASSHSTETSALAAELRRVRAGGSATLEMQLPPSESSSQDSTVSEAKEGSLVHRSPDASLYYANESLPTLVVEVSYSQQRKELPKLADSYIVGSNHAIRCVVGLDIPYAGDDRSATVSVWRPGVDTDGVGINTQDVEAADFRNADGTACEGDLKLQLHDLLPERKLASVHSPPPTITIPFATLCRHLNAAEAPRSERDEPGGPIKFRKRKRSPEEVVDDQREAKYLALEEAELAWERQLDGAWLARSRSRRARADVVVGRRRSARLSRRFAGAEGD